MRGGKGEGEPKQLNMLKALSPTYTESLFRMSFNSEIQWGPLG